MTGSLFRGFAAPRIAVMAGYLLYVSAPAGAAVLDCSEIRAGAGDAGVSISITLTADAGEDVCGIQLDILYNADFLSVEGTESGEAAVEAAKDVHFSIIEPGRARLIVAGFNQNVFSDVIVAYVQFAIAAGAPYAVDVVAPVAVLISDPWGLDIPAAGIAGAIIVGTGGLEGSDIDGDGVCNATDVQLVVNSALGLAVAHDCDVDGDGVVNALDIQRVINAALGIG